MRNTGRTDAKHERRLLAIVRLGGLRLHMSNQSAFHNRMVTVAVGNSDFYDPMEALRRKIIESAKAPEPAPVKALDPTSIDATPTKEIHGSPGVVHWKSAMRRVPRGFIRMWKARPDGHGIAWFFMYQDKVLRVHYHQSSGWTHQVVPAEGLAQD